MRAVLTGLALIAAAAALTGCEARVRPPAETGVCFHVVRDGEAVRFNRLAEEQPSIEYCAARLEEMRLRFLRMGGSNREVIGAYNGQFIFVDRAGVSFAQNLDGGRFFALARTGDGRLAVPGAIQHAPPPPPPPAD